MMNISQFSYAGEIAQSDLRKNKYRTHRVTNKGCNVYDVLQWVPQYCGRGIRQLDSSL